MWGPDEVKKKIFKRYNLLPKKKEEGFREKIKGMISQEQERKREEGPKVLAYEKEINQIKYLISETEKGKRVHAKNTTATPVMIEVIVND